MSHTSRRKSSQRRRILVIVTPLLLLAFVVSAQMAGASVVSGPINNSANGHNYYLLSPDSWYNAETDANSLGGHLVTINDSAENTFIVNGFVTSGHSNDPLWIGISGYGVDYFSWASGEDVTYSAWYWGEITDAGCGAINLPYVSGNTGYHDFWDTAPFFGAPQYYGVAEVVPTPEPATWVLLTIAAAVLLVRRRMK